MVILDDATEVEEDEEKQAFQNDVFLLLPTADCKVTKEPLQLKCHCSHRILPAPELHTEDTSKRHVIS